MFTEITIAAEIQKVTVNVERSDGLVFRTCKLTLAREFDDLIASSLGPDAKKALAGVKGFGMEKVVLPIGRIKCDAKMRGADDYCEITNMAGIKATASAASKLDMPPTIRLEFEFTFREDAWAFLGRNIAAVAEITLSKSQEEFAFEPRPAVVDDDNDEAGGALMRDRNADQGSA